MRHATLADVFNATAGAATQAMGIADRIWREEADTDLQKRQLGIIRESQRFLDELDMDGDADHYLEKWDTFNKELRASQERNLSGVQQSPYYQKRLDELFSQNEVRFESAVRGKQIDRVRQTIKANELESLSEIETIYKNDAQGMINAANEVLQRGLQNRTILPEEYTKMKTYYWDKATAGIIDRGVMDAFKQGKTYDDIDSIIDGIDLNGLTDTRTTSIRQDGQTEGYDHDPQWLAPKREAAKEAGKERAKQTWNTYITGEQKKNENTVSKTYGQILTAVTQGTASRDDILRGIAEVYSFGDPYFDPDERDTYVRWYNDLLKALEKSPDKAMGTAWKNILKTDMAAYIQAGIRGGTGDQRGIDTMYNAYDKWLEESLEKLQEAGYKGNAANMRFDFAETIGTFFDEAEKTLPPQLKGVFKDAEAFIASQYGIGSKPVASDLSTKYPGMKEAITGATMEQLRDWLFGNDLSQMTYDKAEAQVKAIVNAQVAKELDVLREGGFKRTGGIEEDPLLAKAVKGLDNREVVWTDENGNIRYALGTKEGIADVQKRLLYRLQETLSDRGITPGEIEMGLTESVAERDKDGTPIFSARGRQYRFQSDGTAITLQTRAAGNGEWEAYAPSATARSTRSMSHPNRQATIQGEIEGVINASRRNKAITLGGMDPVAWQNMLEQGTAFQFLENLRKTNPEVYEDYKRRVGAGGQR